MIHFARCAFNRQELALVGVTVLWGGGFFVMQQALAHAGPLFLLGVRFGLAGLISLAVFRRHLGGLTRREIRAAGWIGLTLLAGYGLQTLGLRTITSNQSAFLTALYVPLVPLLEWLFLRRKPSLMRRVGIALALAGLLLLTAPSARGLGLGAGESFTLASALAIAAEVLVISQLGVGTDSRRLTVVMLLWVGLVSLLLLPLSGEPLPAFSWSWALPVLLLALSTAWLQWAMNWAQQTVTPTRAALIYAAEPFWGGLVGWFAGEPLPWTSLAGAGCIILGVAVSELRLQGEA